MALLNGPATPTSAAAATFPTAPILLTLSGPLMLFRFLGVQVNEVTKKKRRNDLVWAFWFDRSVHDLPRDLFR